MRRVRDGTSWMRVRSLGVTSCIRGVTNVAETGLEPTTDVVPRLSGLQAQTR